MAKRRESRAARKVHTVMREWKAGTLKSGGSGRTVRSRKQALAIALDSARRVSGRRKR